MTVRDRISFIVMWKCCIALLTVESYLIYKPVFKKRKTLHRAQEEGTGTVCITLNFKVGKQLIICIGQFHMVPFSTSFLCESVWVTVNSIHAFYNVLGHRENQTQHALTGASLTDSYLSNYSQQLNILYICQKAFKHLILSDRRQLETHSCHLVELSNGTGLNLFSPEPVFQVSGSKMPLTQQRLYLHF